MADFHEEEQALEAEALEAILMDDLEVVSAAPPRQYRVKVLPYPNGEGENHVGVRATFSIPPTYPDVPAEVAVAVEKGLSEGQGKELQGYMAGKAEENVGMAMVYALVDAMREWLVEHNIKGQDGSMHAEMLRRMHSKEKEKQRETQAQEAMAKALAAASGESEEDEMNRQKRLEGTAVTPETFLAWRDKFEAELAAKKGGPGKAQVEAAAAALKPTGKEMFLRHLAGTEEADEEAAQYDEEEEARAASRAVEVNAGLFGGDDDDEDDSDFLPDSSDDDDDSDFGSDDDDDDDDSEDGGARAGGGGGGNKGKGRR